MKRWNLKSLLFYSHDGQRRDIDLKPESVNIITGNSHTGKSAIAEVIDYSMGSSECHIPGRVRDACSWVGMIWVKDQTQCIICRKMPPGPKAVSNDVYLDVGANIIAPKSATDLRRTMDCETALRRIEQLLGIGQVQTELFGAPSRTPVRVSLRSVIPYLLQDDQHIINKNALLRTSASDRREQYIIDTLPYVVGAIDETTVAREAELRRLKAALTSEERRQAARQSVVAEESTLTEALIQEAAQVGLLKDIPANITAQAARDILRALDADPQEESSPFATDEQLELLYADDRRLSGEGSTLRNQISAAKRAIQASESFTATGRSEERRLSVVKLIPDEATEDACPLCTQPVRDRVDSVEKVRMAVRRVQGELREVLRERPKIDATIAELENRLTDVTTKVAAVREKIKTLVGETEARRAAQTLSERRSRVLGRISMYLQAAEPTPVLEAQAQSKIPDLQSRIEELESELDPEAKLNGLDLAKARLNAMASEIGALLPLDSRYRLSPFDINLRNLSVGIVTSKRREDMRDVGSDENYLTLHVAFLLAFHRLFAERDRPVPGFILFDQLSRPYYPPDPLRPTQEEVVTSRQPEVSSLRKYFDVLFNEVGRGESLQVLVLEHAYFSDDPRFVSATRERWINGVALIPEDWPEPP
ncbi:DUF3732 domain-containing protein [Stigmatella aurantiaca]|nr:DUF3732 domain-containing protein [Stigmatella aurantiaca]ADO69777.1 conserved uncharacterized protein [Stigmatella aurantiaca DW4/3-1]